MSNQDRAVSPVVGVILMVAVTVLLSAAVFGVVLSFGPSSDTSDDVPSSAVQVSHGEDSVGHYTEIQIANKLGNETLYVKSDLYPTTAIGSDVGDSIRLYEGADYSSGTSITVLRGPENDRTFVQSVTSASHGGGASDSAPAQLMIDNFEDGNASDSWDTSQLNEERNFSWEARTSPTYNGSFSGYFQYGTESCYACIDGGGLVSNDIQPTNSSGPYVFWAYEDQEPEDDIQFSWHGVATVNFYREADSSKDIRIHHDGMQEDTGLQMPNETWVKFRMDNVNFTNGTFDIHATTESGNTLFSYSTLSFNESATQAVDGVTIRGAKANNDVGKYYFDNIQYGQDK